MNDANKFLLSVFLVLAMSAVMLFTESKSGAGNSIIITLELASSVQELKYWVGLYNDGQIQWLRFNTQLDFLFILTYTTLFFLALKSLLQRFSPLKKPAFILTISFIPGVLDVIENIFILDFLNRDFSTSYFGIYYWCVRAKWVLVAAFVFISLTRLGMITRDKIAAK